MKSKLLILIMGLFGSLTLQAQSDMTFLLNKEGKIIVLPKKKNYEFNIPKHTYKSYMPASTRELDERLRTFSSDVQPLRMDERPMDMQVLSDAYAPFFDVYAPMLRRVSPMAFDFNETAVVPVNENITFLANGRQYTWPGAGGLTTLTGALQWQSGRWTLTGNAFGGKYYTPFDPSPRLYVGAGASASYEVNERLKLRAWGQYSYYGNQAKNPHRLLNPFYDQTNVGGSMEFMFNEEFGVGAGVNYEYNPLRQKMERQYLIYPVVRTRGGLSIGVR